MTYKAPPSYGGYAEMFPDAVNQSEVGTPVVLDEAEKMASIYGDNIRVYSGSMELRDDGKIYALSSRAVAVVGVGDDIESARRISLEGIASIKGGALWYRTDIASREHINRSIRHMEQLRRH